MRLHTGVVQRVLVPASLVLKWESIENLATLAAADHRKQGYVPT